MEILPALSLAGNVVQFAELGFKVTKTAIHYYKSADGAHKDLTKDREEAEQYVKVFFKIPNGPLAPKDPDLIELVTRCMSLSDELLNLIDGLRMDPTKVKVIQAAQKSVKALRSRKDVKDLKGRISAVRDAIASRLILLVRYNESS